MKAFDTILDKDYQKKQRRAEIRAKIKRVRKTPLRIFLRNFTITILFLGLIFLGTIYIYKKTICEATVRYSVGEIDPNFNLSKADLVRLSKEAGENWNKALGKKVYIYDENAKLKINLVYDERQRERDLLKKNLSELNVNYESLNELYNYINTQIKNYEKELAEYEAQVTYWNSRGGASRAVFNSLESWRMNLIKKEEKINQLITAFNDSQSKYNLTVDNFNQIVESRKNRIEEEGVFGYKDGRPYINIYVYDSVPEMKLLLMHELGHAKAKTHTSSEDSIMSPVVSEKQIKNLTPSTQDIELIKSCRLTI